MCTKLDQTVFSDATWHANVMLSYLLSLSDKKFFKFQVILSYCYFWLWIDDFEAVKLESVGKILNDMWIKQIDLIIFLWRQSPCSERANSYERGSCEKQNSSEDELM